MLTVTSDSYSVVLSSNGEQTYTFVLETLEVPLTEPVSVPFEVTLTDHDGNIVKQSYHESALIPNDDEDPDAPGVPVPLPIDRTGGERDPNRIPDDPFPVDMDDETQWGLPHPSRTTAMTIGLVALNVAADIVFPPKAAYDAVVYGMLLGGTAISYVNDIANSRGRRLSAVPFQVSSDT